jgi:hypothetical protein
MGVTEPGSSMLEGVKAELIQLRRMGGLTREGVEKYAKTTMMLECVDHEIDRRRNPLTRHVATYNVICCAIEHLIADHRYRVYLEHHLNVREKAPLVTPLPSVGARTSNAANQLFVSVDGANHAAKVIDSAFGELAAALVGAEESPCADGPERAAAHRRKVSQVAAESLNLVQILALCAEVSSRDVQDELGRKLNEALPVGMRMMREAGSRRARSGAIAEALILHAVGTAPPPLAIVMARGELRELFRSEQRSSRPVFDERTRAALTLLADHIQESEVRGWPAGPKTQTPRRRQARPRPPLAPRLESRQTAQGQDPNE